MFTGEQYKFSPKEEAAFQVATHCYMCEEPIDEERGKVRDQITRKVAGLRYRVPIRNHKVYWYNPQGESPAFQRPDDNS